MNKEEITAAIIRIAAERYEVDAEDIKPGSGFYEDLGSDWLDMLDVVSAIEEEFAIEISDEAVEKVLTIAGAADLVERLLEVKA